MGGEERVRNCHCTDNVRLSVYGLRLIWSALVSIADALDDDEGNDCILHARSVDDTFLVAFQFWTCMAKRLVICLRPREGLPEWNRWSKKIAMVPYEC